MTISLPESLKEFVERQVSSGRYPNAETYVGSLIEADLNRRFQERLEDLVIKGLDSGPASDMTAQDWQDIRREGLALARSRHDLAS